MSRDLESITQEYLKGKLGRRQFLGRLTAVLGSYTLTHQYLEKTGLAAGPMSRLESQRANVESSEIRYPSAEHSILASLSLPSGADKAPGVIVIHENRGLNEHTREVARRLAAEGFVGLAPDLLSRVGGTADAGSPDEARNRIREIGPEEAVADLIAGRRYLNGRPECQGQKVGSVGFCWGGARSFLLATADPELGAAVVFYGSPPPAEKMAEIRCPVLGLYGELDTRITSTVAATEATMQELGKSYQARIYPGADHAFFNDSRAERYHEESAADAWQRTLAFFREHLG